MSNDSVLLDENTGAVRRLSLVDADAPYFSALLTLAANCTLQLPAAGKESMGRIADGGLAWLVGLGGTAARNGFPTDYTAAVELAALRGLSAETATDLLAAAIDMCGESSSCGNVENDDDDPGGERWAWLRRLMDRGRQAAAEGFEAAAASAGFLRLSEPAVAGLLDHPGLQSRREEGVFEAVARWIRDGRGAKPPNAAATDDGPVGEGTISTAAAAKGRGVDGRALRGESLLRRVRFPLMSRQYLSESAGEAVPEWTGCGPLVDSLILEALEVLRFAPHGADDDGRSITAAAAAVAAAGGMRLTPTSAVVPRAGAGLPWARFAAAAGGGGRRLAAGGTASAVALGDGWACVGLREGRVGVWSLGGPEPVRRHTLSGHSGWVRALVVWAGRLVSGSSDKTARLTPRPPAAASRTCRGRPRRERWEAKPGGCGGRGVNEENP